MRSRRSKLPGLLATAATLTAGLALATAPPAGAAASDVVISELMYHAVSDLDGDDFLELSNRGTTPVDLSGWTFGGITLTLPAGTTLAPGGFVVVAKDAAQFRATYGFTPAAVYEGNLSNSGETVTLRDSGGTTIDTVSFLDVDPWPSTPDGLGPSLELIDASLDNDDPLNWAAATDPAGHTAGAVNSVRRTGLGPRIVGVTATPTEPLAGQPTTINATITGQDSATLRYRLDFDPERTVAMTRTGTDTFRATIPGAAAGHLIRYRVEATNAVATTLHPRVDDTIDFHGLVVPHAITSAIPVLEWFISDADYDTMVSNPEADISRPAAIAYDGVVIDNVEVEIKGHASQRDPKVSWKFHLPQGHDLDLGGLLIEPVDEFDMQADWSDQSHGRSIISWEAYQRAGIADHQMFPIRTQRNGAFQGLYSFSEVFDGTWREREGYENHQFFEAETSAFNPLRPLTRRFSKKSPDDGDFAPLASFVDGIGLTGTAQRDHLLGSADLPELINYAAVTAIIEHVDSSSKNFYLAQDPVTSRWSILPWDLDHTWGNGCCQVASTFVTPAEPGDKTSELMRALLAVPEWRDMYFRRLRTLVDDVLAAGRLEALYDARLGPAQETATLDIASWPYAGTSPSYATYRRRLFAAIQERRDIFAADARVAAEQPAAPNIVIDEIQHSPTAGDTAEFVELYNPHTRAIDLSGWSIVNGVSLTIQPGTVILPHATMTFVSNDPAFRAAYSPTVFVGDRYTGNLPARATLTLTRPDGSTADSVAYGGDGWPVPTSGQSLELSDPAADNSNGANWSLSTGSGTPGALSGTPATVPGAPVIGIPAQGAIGGDLTATARWSPPASTGGSPITGYRAIALRMSSSATDATVLSRTSSPVLGASVRQRSFTLAAGNYRFVVVAINAVGTGPTSARSVNVVPR